MSRGKAQPAWCFKKVILAAVWGMDWRQVSKRRARGTNREVTAVAQVRDGDYLARGGSVGWAAQDRIQK